MIMTAAQAVITVAIVVSGTIFTRFISYLAFPEGKQIPSFILYLGKVLGPAVFGLLVVYCFRNTDFLTSFADGGAHGLPELAGLLMTSVIFCRTRSMMLAMAAGTAIYMFLVQGVF